MTVLAEVTPRPGWFSGASRNLRALTKQSRTVTGMVILGVLLIMAVFAPLLTRWDPNSLDYGYFLKPGVDGHWLGTTALGQDIWSQLVFGARLSLMVGFVAGLFATAISVALGLAAAYFGGWVDEVINFIVNVMLVLPGLPLLIIVSAFLRGGGVWPIILVISLTGWAWGARVLRSQALALRGRDFVQASVATGEGAGRIIFVEMLPNLAGLIAANFFGAALYAVLSEAGLSFLGVGDVGIVTWGTMLYWSQAKGALLQGAWWWVAAPGLCIALLGTSFALLNFAIDQLSNPRLRATGAKRVRRKWGNAGSQTEAAPALELRHLEAGYASAAGRVRAVRDVSLTVQRGEFLGLAGESGCGKSTLAFAAARLLEAPGQVFSGEARLAGQDLLALSPEDLRQVRWRDYSVVFQASMNVLNPVIKIREQVYDAMQAHGIKDKAKLEARALELFRLVGIREDYLNAYPHQLSGGMKQRVVIAIALALEPKVVIMDEPTTALDVVVQRQLLQEIDAVRRRLNLSIVFITHDLSLLVELADKVAIMYAGELVEQAPARELYERPLHPYTERLMNAFPPIEGPRVRRDGIPGRPPSLSAELPGCPFFERCGARMPGLCDVRKPRLLEVSPQHTVSCFLHDPSVPDSVKSQSAEYGQAKAKEVALDRVQH